VQNNKNDLKSEKGCRSIMTIAYTHCQLASAELCNILQVLGKRL